VPLSSPRSFEIAWYELVVVHDPVRAAGVIGALQAQRIPVREPIQEYLDPDRHGREGGPQTTRGEGVIGLEQPLELEKGLVVEDDRVQLIEGESGFLEAGGAIAPAGTANARIVSQIVRVTLDTTPHPDRARALAASERIEKRIVERQRYLNYSGVSSAPGKPTSTTRTPKGSAQFSGGSFTGMEMPKHNWVQRYPVRLISRKPKSAYPITTWSN